MPRNLYFKGLTRIIVGAVFFSLTFGFIVTQKFYSSIFRLSSNQVLGYLYKNTSQCNKISDCKLLPGDILIRRYITERTWLIDKLANPYFTHSAFYLGDGQIVEAVGTEKNSIDDIQIATLSESDWFDASIESWVVVRPKNISPNIETVKNNLKNIAVDPDYIFGLPKQGQKRATCADLISNQLLKENVVQISNTPRIVTPDYLFWITVTDPTNFEIIAQKH